MGMKKILIVDDKRQIANILNVYLKASFDCFYKESALEAVDWIREGNMPDLIVTDLRMNGMTGEEFLDYLKFNEQTRDIPVVVLSAEDSTTAKVRILEKGAVDYIVKPFNPTEVKTRISKILGL